jgi:hypothetical protein
MEGQLGPIVRLLSFIRERFDAEFFFESVLFLEMDIQQDIEMEKKKHSKTTSQPVPKDTPPTSTTQKAEESKIITVADENKTVEASVKETNEKEQTPKEALPVEKEKAAPWQSPSQAPSDYTQLSQTTAFHILKSLVRYEVKPAKAVEPQTSPREKTPLPVPPKSTSPRENKIELPALTKSTSAKDVKIEQQPSVKATSPRGELPIAGKTTSPRDNKVDPAPEKSTPPKDNVVDLPASAASDNVEPQSATIPKESPQPSSPPTTAPPPTPPRPSSPKGTVQPNPQPVPVTPVRPASPKGVAQSNPQPAPVTPARPASPKGTVQPNPQPVPVTPNRPSTATTSKSAAGPPTPTKATSQALNSSQKGAVQIAPAAKQTAPMTKQTAPMTKQSAPIATPPAKQPNANALIKHASPSASNKVRHSVMLPTVMTAVGRPPSGTFLHATPQSSAAALKAVLSGEKTVSFQPQPAKTGTISGGPPPLPSSNPPVSVRARAAVFSGQPQAPNTHVTAHPTVHPNVQAPATRRNTFGKTMSNKDSEAKKQTATQVQVCFFPRRFLNFLATKSKRDGSAKSSQ